MSLRRKQNNPIRVIGRRITRRRNLILLRSVLFAMKMFLFALSAGGQQGIEHLLKNMHDEIYRNMVLMGCKNLKELNSSKLIYRK